MVVAFSGFLLSMPDVSPVKSSSNVVPADGIAAVGNEGWAVSSVIANPEELGDSVPSV